MDVYKRKPTEMALWCLFAAVTALMGFSLAWTNGWPLAVQIALPATLAAPFLYFALYRDNMRIEITHGGEFRVYRLGRLVHCFNLHECQVSHRGDSASKRRRGPQALTLTITGPEDDAKPIKLDCGPLGRTQFTAMCAVLAQYVP